MTRPYRSRLTAEQRSMAARVAALTRWANCQDRTAATQPARDALAAKWAEAPSPDAARALHMSRMSLAASKKRRAS